MRGDAPSGGGTLGSEETGGDAAAASPSPRSRQRRRRRTPPRNRRRPIAAREGTGTRGDGTSRENNTSTRQGERGSSRLVRVSPGARDA
jgi:hypothetical protein